MKKGIALLLVLMLVLACSACSKEEEKNSSSVNTSTETNSILPVVSKPDTSSVPETNTFTGVNAERVITFGSYEQDNILDNGPEPIEWIVLDTQDGKALLLSKYGLDAQLYNTESTDVTWETCTLRTWLNNDFLNTAFNTKEQSAIQITEVDNSAAQGYDWSLDKGTVTTGGNNTQDKVFLLSCQEAYRYLHVMREDNDNIQARVAPTPYAVAHRSSANNDYKTADRNMSSRWWLRSPGEDQQSVSDVYYGGMLSSQKISYDFKIDVVRPAIWVDLNSGIF